MSSLPGILFFVIGLLLSVAIHELGHLIPAKKFGVKVSRYFIGFGPTLTSTHRGGTEWGIKAIPLGGFVSLAGMLAPAKAGTRTHNPDGTPTLAEEARQLSAEELAPGEEHMAFWRLPAYKKLIVMFGGPLTNLVIAFVLFSVMILGIGLPSYTSSVSAVSTCVAGGEACDSADKAPASGVFEPGDQILEWDGVPVDSWAEVQTAIAESKAAPTNVLIERNGSEQTVTVTPVMVERPVVTANGTVQLDDDGDPVTAEVAYVGISPGIERIRGTILDVPLTTWEISKATAGVVLQLPVQLWNTATTLITGGERDANSVVGIVGVADMAGSISATQSADYGFIDRLGDLLLLLASLNISLFIFNMLPLLPLDGGHILGALIEGVRRQVAKWRGKPDPGAFDTARLLPLSNLVILFFIGMTILLIVADIVNPVV